MVEEWTPQPGKETINKQEETPCQKKEKTLQASHQKKSNCDKPLCCSKRTALRREQCGVQPKSLII
jgi:hypothetical protein